LCGGGDERVAEGTAGDAFRCGAFDQLLVIACGKNEGRELPTPMVSGFEPISGLVGTTVTITGAGFTGASSVKFNGAVAAYNVDSDVQITATVPNGATTGPISVTTPAATITSATSFVVTAPTDQSHLHLGLWRRHCADREHRRDRAAGVFGVRQLHGNADRPRRPRRDVGAGDGAVPGR
jgi:hypothetical protein